MKSFLIIFSLCIVWSKIFSGSSERFVFITNLFVHYHIKSLKHCLFNTIIINLNKIIYNFYLILIS